MTPGPPPGATRFALLPPPAAGRGTACRALVRHHHVPTTPRTLPSRLRLPLALLAALLILAALPDGAAAHPLGNFTTNQYARLELDPAGLRLVYVLDLAEIPAFQEIARIDGNGDDEIDAAERTAYLDAKLAEITPALHLAAGAPLPLALAERDVTFPEGQAGLTLVRLRATFTAPLPDASAPLTFRNDYARDRLGWREIVVTHDAGVRLDAADAPTTDLSDELRAYPEDLLSNPLDRTAASVAFTLVPGAPAAPGFGDFGAETVPRRLPGGFAGDRLADLLTGDDPTAAGVLLALLLAAAWGAVHALSPGHGKTVVGAYLVGARGTARHAIFLGLTVTITHTAGVLALGLVTLFASRYVVPERLYPWMGLASGLLVVALGLAILRQRLRGEPAFGHHHGPGHTHPHTHTHPQGLAHRHGGFVHTHDGATHTHLPPGADGTQVTWRSLLALGVSGGLLPCPSALVVLLGAIALGRVGFGLALVLAFSLGLAAALTGVGLLFLHAGRFLERRAAAARWAWTAPVLRYAPVAGALAVTLAGLAIVARALDETRLL